MSNSTWSKHIEQWVQFLNQLIANTEDEGLRIKSERQLKTIECVRYSAVLNPKLISEFINPSNVVPSVSDISEYFLELNEAQKSAVNIAVGDNVLFLIQGPPGTGKTQVIAEICLQLYKQNPNIRILVCSETHIAVNNLISRISSYNDNIRFIRIRDKEQDNLIDEYTPRSIIDSYIEWLNRYCKDKETIDIITQSFSNTDDISLEKSLALSSNITGMTCNRVGAYEFESSHEMFDIVIIDEVCKATLPEILMPLSVAKKAVLVGDPKQLPPIFCSEEIDIIKNIDQCDLQNYMFVDKLFSVSQNVIVLDTQYRMTNQIGNLISTLFYDGKLKNGRAIDAQYSVVWVDYEPTHAWPIDNDTVNDKPKIYNINECEIIHHLLLDFNTRFNKDTKVAIITPYKYQAFVMKKYLKLDEYNNLIISIDTVDGFQGKECDAVIFSLTRTTGTYRFLADNRRLNVALSRARDSIYIVGNRNYAQHNSLLNKVLDLSKILGCKFELCWK